MSTIAATVIMLLSICLLSKLDFLPGMSVSARAADYDVTFRIANDGDGGKITATSGNNSVTVMLEGGLNIDGNNTTITVEPYEGYCLGDIRVFHDGSEQNGVLFKKSDNTYQLLATVASYYEVVVSFEPNDGHRINITNKSTYAYYEITVKRDGKLININKNSLIAKYGDKITIKFSPLPKHIITDIALAPKISDSITNYNTYTVTFTMPDNDVTVSSSHELMFDINFASTEHGSVTANKTSSKKFETITLNVTPEDGYRLSSLKVMAGSTQITVTDNKFTMPESDVTVTAEFEKINTIQECNISGWNYLKENADPSIATVTTENGVTTVKLNSCIIISNEFEINDENVVIDLNGYGIRGDYNKHEDNNGKLVFNLNYIMVKAGNKLTITDTYKGSDREYYINLDDNGRGYSVSNEGNESETCIKVTGGYITGLCPVNGGIVLACNYGSEVGSALTIEDGTLVGNYCDSECSVVYVNDYCTFTMNGGRIINNKAMSSSVLAVGTFIMNDGIISENTVNNCGGGVSVYGTFVMNGGTVSGNTAGDRGGGVYVTDGTFIMTNGTISGNTATTGANIYTYSNGGEYIGKFYRLPGITVTDTDKSNGSVEKVIGKITTSDTENGSIAISADDSVTVGEIVYYPDGSTVTVTATPAKGYTVKSIKYDDTVIIPADGVYSFTMPAGDVTVTAEFELVDYTITKSNVHGTVITKVNDVNSGTDTAHYGDTVTITATPDEGYGLITFAVRDVDGNLIPVIDNTFTMPASNITVTAVFAEPKEPVAYIDADGTEKTVEYYTVLDGSQLELTDGWYVINSKDLEVENTLKPSGDVNIILVDGCFMNVNTGTYSLECETYTNLCIYGQNKGTGEMVLKSNASGTSVKINGSLTINGGIWESCKTYISGTDSTKDCFTINGGNILMQAFYNDAPLEIKGGKCSINGGKVVLECEYSEANSISSEYGIILGYKKGADYICLENCISGSTVTIAEGKTFTDGTNTYDHSTPSDTLKALNNVTLTPAGTYSVTIASIEHGSVSADKKALEDETVSLNITPDADYIISSLTVTDSDNNPVSVTKNYTFTMPAKDVTITAEFQVVDFDMLINMINKLPAPQYVSFSNKSDIEYIRSVYDNLSDDSKANINSETLKKFTDAEEALAINIVGNGTKNNPWIISTWADLKATMSEGGFIKLGADVTDSDKNSSSFLKVDSDKTVTLDLNGHSIDRGLAEDNNAADNGYVILNLGTLTVRDSSGEKDENGYDKGRITGGNSTGDGGGICNGGTLIIESVTITGNKANNGGGIYNTGALSVIDAEILRNTAERNGGGIYNNNIAEINRSEITGNSCLENGGGIYVGTSGTLNFGNDYNVVTGNKKEG